MSGRVPDGPKIHPKARRSRRSQNRTVRNSPPPPKERADVVLRLLILSLIFAAAFYAVQTDRFVLGNVEVRGGVRLSDSEIVDLAALADFDDAWTFFIFRESIRESLIAHPLIEQAEISITGLHSVMIEITERRPLAALEHNGCRLLFDRTGELIDITGPDQPCLYPIVSGVPVGLLRFRHEPLYLQSDACGICSGRDDVAGMELQFNRLIHLQHMLKRTGDGCPKELDRIIMQPNGELTVKFLDCPEILLGKFDHPDSQYRRLLAVLENDEITDPQRTLNIDLSSELFPCYHVRREYLTLAERRQITRWEVEPGADETVDTAESVEQDSFRETDEESGEVVIGNEIFSLTGDASDEEE